MTTGSGATVATPRVKRNRSPEDGVAVAGDAVLNALPNPVMAINDENEIVMVNAAAEIFLDGSAALLMGMKLEEAVPADSPIFRMIEQTRLDGASRSDYDLILESPRVGSKMVNVQIAPMSDETGRLVLTLQERSIADKMARQLSFRGAARSVTAMAAMLAHEVKNPLSGIRGAAQLLEQNASEPDIPLTQLICDETDRICRVVDRMEIFTDDRPIQREAINIHEVLDHCRRIAATGFGRSVTFIERYDPSLPAVLGNRDILIQVLLNLLKNACEAVPEDGGEIKLSTSYRHGMRVAVAGSGRRLHLPLQVAIQDNGPGIPEDLIDTLFEPFITTKRNGSGLGLAFVAKAVADHGGIIEVEPAPRRTVFRLTFPIAEQVSAETPMPSLSTGGGSV